MLTQTKSLTTRIRITNIVLFTFIVVLLTSLLFIIAISQTDLLEDQQHVSLSIQPRSYEEAEWNKLLPSDISSLGEFCHHPDKPVLGLEGLVPDGFDLKQSHILVTPGEVTLTEISAARSSPIFCTKPNDHNEQIKMEQLDQNLGKQTNYSRPEVAENLQNGLALSAVGIKQLVKLGQYFRGLYLEDLNLENHLSSPRHIKIYTSGNFLTEESASTLLYGLLPKDSINKIHTISLMSHMCSDRWSQVSCHCPSLSVLEMKIKKLIYEDEVTRKGYGSTFKSENVHQTLSNLCLYSERDCYIQNKSFHLNILNDLIMQVVDNHAKLSKNDDFVDLVHIYLYPFLQNLVNVIHHVDNVFEKFFMYSVDREFLFYLLNVFKFPVKTLPRAGSRVVLELYKKSGQLFQPYFVRILYNGADISRFIPFCQVKMDHGLCRLKSFVTLLSWKIQKQDLRSAYHNICS